MNIKSINCFVCSKKIKRLYTEQFPEIEDITQHMWEGSSIEISGCFGSEKFDGAAFHGVVCDDCVELRLKNLYQIVGISTERKKYEYTKRNNRGRRKTKRSNG